MDPTEAEIAAMKNNFALTMALFSGKSFDSEVIQVKFFKNSSITSEKYCFRSSSSTNAFE